MELIKVFFLRYQATLSISELQEEDGKSNHSLRVSIRDSYNQVILGQEYE